MRIDEEVDIANGVTIGNDGLSVTNDFWVPRRWGLLIAGLVGLPVAATALVLLAESGREVLGYLLAVVSTAVAVSGVLSRRVLAEVERAVGEQELQTQEVRQRQALANPGDPEPADVGFRSPRADAEPELVGWRDDGGGARGTLSQLVDYYLQLERGRLAILGVPGAGKTVAVRALVLGLLRTLLAEPLSGSKRPPAVPVLLNLAGWNLGDRWLAAATDQELTGAFDAWIVAHLVEVHRVRRSDAHRLVAGRRIMPVLDGLDEMDAGNSAQPRAAAVMRVFNEIRGRHPVVLVCRRADYVRLASRPSHVPGTAPVLQNMQQILLEDLTYEKVREYVAYRFPDPSRRTGVQARWEPLLAALRARKERRSDLAAVLARPWRLFLAVTVYYAADSEPSELTRIPPAEVVDHLLVRLVPVVVARYPRLGSDRRYDPVRVEAWLVAFARHLATTSTERGWSPTELRLDDLWPAAGWCAPRWLTAGLRAFPYMAGFGAVLFAALAGLVPTTPGVGLAAVLLAVGLAAAWREHDPRPRPVSRRDLRQGMRPMQFLGGRAIGLVVGIMGGLGGGANVGYWTGRPMVGLVAGVTLGLMCGSTAGVVTGLRRMTGLDRPSSFLCRDLAAELRFTFLPLLVMGFGLAIWLVLLAGLPLILGAVLIGFALIFGGLLGFISFLTVSRWPRYWVAVAIASRRGVLPARPAMFLDWAYAVGLVRLSGIAVEFRHQEFQAWLAAGGSARL